MGLQERQAAQDFQNNDLPALQNELNTLVGSEVEIEADWDSLTEDGLAAHLASHWTNLYFKPLFGVLSEIASTDLGKQALQDSFKKLSLKNTLETSNKRDAVSFADNTLTIDHEPATNVPDCDFSNGDGDMTCREMRDVLRDVLNANL